MRSLCLSTDAQNFNAYFTLSLHTPTLGLAIGQIEDIISIERLKRKIQTELDLASEARIESSTELTSGTFEKI
jgi:hypothetical protein